MRGRCTGGQHHAPMSGGACPCGAVSRHPVVVPVRAGDEEIVAALAEALPRALPHTVGCVAHRTDDVAMDHNCICFHDRVLPGLFTRLLPAVQRIAEQRAAAELRAAAGQLQAAADVRVNATVAGRVDENRRGVGDGLEWAADDLRARAAALTATPNHGTDATT